MRKSCSVCSRRSTTHDVLGGGVEGVGPPLLLPTVREKVDQRPAMIVDYIIVHLPSRHRRPVSAYMTDVPGTTRVLFYVLIILGCAILAAGIFPLPGEFGGPDQPFITFYDLVAWNILERPGNLKSAKQEFSVVDGYHARHPAPRPTAPGSDPGARPNPPSSVPPSSYPPHWSFHGGEAAVVYGMQALGEERRFADWAQTIAQWPATGSRVYWLGFGSWGADKGGYSEAFPSTLVGKRDLSSGARDVSSGDRLQELPSSTNLSRGGLAVESHRRPGIGVRNGGWRNDTGIAPPRQHDSIECAFPSIAKKWETTGTWFFAFDARCEDFPRPRAPDDSTTTREGDNVERSAGLSGPHSPSEKSLTVFPTTAPRCPHVRQHVARGVRDLILRRRQESNSSGGGGQREIRGAGSTALVPGSFFVSSSSWWETAKILGRILANLWKLYVHPPGPEATSPDRGHLVKL
jgi:hypothetical protein